MHEMALADGILSVVLEAAGEHPVRRVRLKIGKLQHVTQESLQFSYQLLAEDTTAADATLELDSIDILLSCNSCSKEQVALSVPFVCSKCGSFDLKILQGDEVVVELIELQDGTVLQKPGTFDMEPLNQHNREHHGIHTTEGTTE